MTTRYRFSANTGFLYPELHFLDRIRAAATDGFDAVEFHDEGQATERAALKRCLRQTGLQVVGLNVAMRPTAGCAAIPGDHVRARHEIEEAIELADDIDAAAIHVLAGNTRDPAARDAFIASLEFALDATDRIILIEPLCSLKMPDYFLNSLHVAAGIVDDIGRPNLKILFDCFHVEQEHGDTLSLFRANVDRIGHVQIASHPARAEPGVGPASTAGGDSLDYARLLPAFRSAGYNGILGCEYTPSIMGDGAFAWRHSLQAQAGARS